MRRVLGNTPSGFRFLRLDAFVLIGTGGLAVALRRLDLGLEWPLLFVVGHFFVFCNVVRPGLRLELLWSAAFVGNLMIAPALDWTSVFIGSAPASFAVVLWAISSPDHRGVALLGRSRHPLPSPKTPPTNA